ncbi:MAG: efflux RND transporter periplasmic adaptor subunit [Candidatus Thiodiazotropha sp.]
MTEEILRPVRTLEVMPTTGKLRREFPAVVDAARSADLSFRISGVIKEMPVKEGDRVEKGEVIAMLDQADARIELKVRQANYETALANYNRGKKLVAPGHLSQADFDKLKNEYASAEAQLIAAKQTLGYTVLKASFDGRISKRHVELHEEVSAQERIVTLQDMSSLTIRIQVPESVMLRSRKDSQDNDYFVQFESIPEQRFPLKLKEAAIIADAENQTYQVSFTTPRVAGYTLLPGMNALVTVESSNGLAQADFHVPASSVMEDGEGRFVYTVMPEREDVLPSAGENSPDKPGIGIIERRAVTTGVLDARGLLITSGLSQGDHVLTAGMSQAQPGMKVLWSPDQAF